MNPLPAHTAFAIAVGSLCALLITGCALPSRLSLANRLSDPLEGLTHDDESEQAQSPYPTSLSNPRWPQALRPVGQPASPTVQKPIQPALPLQRTGTAAPKPLDPQQLAGRLPIHFGPHETGSVRPPPDDKPPTNEATVDQPKNAIVLTPASVDVPSLFAALESSWPVSIPPGPANALPLSPVNVKPTLAANPSIAASADAAVATDSRPPWAASLDVQAAKEEPTETSEALLQRLIKAVEKEIRERTDRKEEAELPALEQKRRLLLLVADRSDDAVERIEKLPPAEREAFKQLMFALSIWLSPDEAKRSGLRNAKILRSLHEVDTRLSTVSKLDLKNLTFCEKVESFGWFTEFPRAEFSPKQQVILYVEVQNFAAEEKTAVSFETELQGSYQIFDSAGSIVDERQLPLDKEICRNYRRDYFLAYRIYLPELPAGRYRLELAIEDLKAKKEFKGSKQGEAMIEFTIR